MSAPTIRPPAALGAMAGRLTVPFQRGADILELSLLPGASAERAAVDAYDFRENQARFGRIPDISYVLRALAPVGSGTQVIVRFSDPAFPGGVASTSLSFADGAAEGDSFVIPLPPLASFGTRMVRLTETLDGKPSPIDGHWSVTALLGTLARLLWVVGVERDRLTRVRREIRDQRSVATAAGTSLDFIGADLGVPRFPPTPYSFDSGTIVLYHLDDAPGASPAVLDSAAAFPGRTAHHGTLTGSVSQGQRGRYDRGAGFTDTGSIVVASHADFDLSATQGFTVECFVRPEAASGLGQVISRLTGAGVGWSIEVGDIGVGVPNAVRATLSDGITTMTATSAASLPSDRFTHVAAVLGRDPANPGSADWTLSVGGVLMATASGSVGPVGGPADVVIGPGTSGFRGTVDEVRLSSAARASFHPALGEADDQYRRRLGLFRRWVLPTPADLAHRLNQLVREIDGVADPFVIDDTDGPMLGGRHLVRVWPVLLAPRQSIDANGRMDIPESSLWPADDGIFDPALLGRHQNPQISYATPAPDPARDPGLPAADPHLMQPSVAASLDRLATLAAAAGFSGQLIVQSGYEPAAADSRSAGRAVILRLPPAGPGRLAALAHRAGFDYVEYRGDATVYAASAPGLALLVGPLGAGATLLAGGIPELTVGDTVQLTTALPTATYATPILPGDAEVRFWLIAAASGRGVLTAAPGSPTATLTATAPGLLTVSADIARSGHVATVTSSIAVRPGPLADGSSIAADGTMGIDVGVLGPAEPTFDPAYLTRFDDPRVTFGAAPEDRLMQRGLALLLTVLLDQLSAAGVTGTLTLTSAYQPGAVPTDIASRGRLLVIAHSTLAPGALAVHAHRAGFGFVQVKLPSVVVAGPAADLVGVDGRAEVDVGAGITLTVAPDPSAVSPTTRLGWSTGQAVATKTDEQGLILTSTTAPTVTVVGAVPGLAWVRATLRGAGDAGPYAFTVRLRPELAGARISRDDYYLVMNALHTLHPVGVEVLTESIRSAVVELGTAPSGLDPSFTYPAFRLHRAAAASRKDNS